MEYLVLNRPEPLPIHERGRWRRFMNQDTLVKLKTFGGRGRVGYGRWVRPLVLVASNAKIG